eukprot:3661111-Alexandrium_andersonii.AAC.1
MATTPSRASAKGFVTRRRRLFGRLRFGHGCGADRTRDCGPRSTAATASRRLNASPTLPRRRP